MSGLTGVTQFNVPARVVSDTMCFLAAMGTTGNEGLVLWTGAVEATAANVTAAVVPPQTPLRSEYGLSIYVGADALHELGVVLHQRRLRLLAQVHSHGEGAYHSETDDQCSIVTTLGGLSIVVPDFARNAFDFDTCSVHRLGKDGWAELSDTEARAIVRVGD